MVMPANREVMFKRWPSVNPPGVISLSERERRLSQIEAASKAVLALPVPSYQALKRILERSAVARSPQPPLTQSGAAIRDIGEYQQFFMNHAASTTTH